MYRFLFFNEQLSQFAAGDHMIGIVRGHFSAECSQQVAKVFFRQRITQILRGIDQPVLRQKFKTSLRIGIRTADQEIQAAEEITDGGFLIHPEDCFTQRHHITALDG